MNGVRFIDREDAGLRLVDRLRGRRFERLLVLAIPRGGLEIAAPIARALDGELDVVLSRKLRAPMQPELALGAVSESGDVYLNPQFAGISGAFPQHLEHERTFQMAEIERRVERFRAVRPKAGIAGRSVIIVDDGIATGATLIAALGTVRAQAPRELIVAVPVAPEECLSVVRPLCDDLVCLSTPAQFYAVGAHYESFETVTDERVVELLANAWRRTRESSAMGPEAVSGASERVR